MISGTNDFREMAKAALEQTGDAIFITNTQGIIEYVNRAFVKMTGYSKEEAVENTPRMIKSGFHDEDFYRNLWSTVMAGETFREVMVNRRKDGGLFYADHTISPLKNAKGEVTHFVASWKDITKQIEAERHKDEFIGLVSHELKTPLTTLKTYAQILKKQARDEKQGSMEERLDRMDAQVDKLNKLINNLLEITRLEVGNLSLILKPLPLGSLIEEVIETFKLTHDKYRFKTNGTDDIEVLGDRGRLEQVLINLISNAVKFSTGKKVVEVEVEVKKNMAVVAVVDYGLGIPETQQKRLFERFYRVSGKRFDQIPGLGLGLYLSYEIIKHHQGEMWVESEPKKGSRFFFSLPLA